jgi:uncharacterized protein (DUF1501 family)
MKRINRRDFLKTASLVSAVAFAPGFMKRAGGRLFSPESEKVLVIVQLSGGNDGLNMVIPYADDTYYRLRPAIGLQQNTVLKLDEHQALNPEMSGLRDLFNDGLVSVINNVGYPNPDRSHFRSMDIWHTASDSNQYMQTGWLGRFLDSHCEGGCPAHAAIEFDDTLSLALKGERVKGLSIKAPDQLLNAAQNKIVTRINELSHSTGTANLSYLYRTLSETEASVAYLKEQFKKTHTAPDYPGGQFAANLKRIANLIVANSDVRIYYVSLPGFDTHVNQLARQNRLLGELSSGLSAFMKDLKQNGKGESVLTMLFSEFGRRVKQNASNGTDHGTASNVLLLSQALKKPGIINPPPDLANLDQGDLRYSVDFKSVYATILSKWLQTPHETILGRPLPVMDFLG